MSDASPAPVAYVTGGAGFLGSYLVERLLAAGTRVLVIDDFRTGSPDNLRAALEDERCALIEADVAAPWSAFAAAIPKAFATPALIVHAASPASPRDYANDPFGTLHVNALGTIEAVQLARAAGARLVYFSTSEVYGDPHEHPQAESYWGNVNSVGPRACYDEGKRFGEAYATTAARVDGLDVRIARIFNTYGPRMRPGDGRVIPNFCRSVIRDEPLTVYGDGSQTRSFCYVDDTIEGIFRLATRPGLGGRVVNIGNPAECTVRELARTLATMAGIPLRMAHESLPVDDPVRRRPDITLARELLDWEPRVPLEEGLRRTLDDARRRIASPADADVA